MHKGSLLCKLSSAPISSPVIYVAATNTFEESVLMELLALQRVKVYRLNDEGKWDDKGTGHVSVEYLEVCFFSP